MRILAPILAAVGVAFALACDPPPAEGEGDGATEGEGDAVVGEGEGEEPPCFDFNERRCSADGTVVERCTGATNTFEPETFCAATESCAVVDGVVDCVVTDVPPERCDNIGERRCSPDGTFVERCSGALNEFVLDETCQPGASCTVDAGVADCRLAIADENCRPGARICSADGRFQLSCEFIGGTTEVWSEDECQITETCVEDAGVAVCVNVFTDPNFCTPGTRRCSTDDLHIEVCDDDSYGFTFARTCEGVSECAAVDGVLTCLDPGAPPVVICQANRRFCDGDAVVQCDPQGLSVDTVEACDADEVCSTQAGVLGCFAVPPVVSCTPNRRFCDGARVLTCNAAGNGATAFDTCSADEVCNVVAGVAGCQPTSTPPASCAPGARRCEGNLVQSCNSDGQSFRVVDTCAGDEVCGVSAGVTACVAPAAVTTCTANRRFCDGNQLLTCNAAGTGATLFTTCAGDEVCGVAAGVAQCLAPSLPSSCTPGTRVCGDNTVLACDSSGLSFNAFESCAADEVCGTAAGVTTCIAAAPVSSCTPNRRFCDGSRVLTCNSSGTGADVFDTCAVDEVCGVVAGVATCEAPAPTGLCTPGARACDGSRILSCQSNGSFAVQETCGADELCSLVANVPTCAAPPAPQVCTPNTSRCSGELVVGCSAAGVESVVDSCGAAESCVAAGNSASCVADGLPTSCTPGAQRCDGALVVECDASGREFVAVACDAGEVCALDFGSPRCIAGTLDCATPDSCVCTPADVATCDATPAPGTRTGFLFVEKRFESCGAAPVTTTCAEGLVCQEGPGCTSSVLDEQSPFYEFSCPLVQQLEVKTAFDADCRCFINQGTDGPDVCDRPTRVAQTGFRQGAGPSMFGVNGAELNGGIVDGDDILVAAQWGSSGDRHGLVLAIDKGTGDRRIVSGAHPDGDVGAGPAFAFAIDVKKGPDGDLYVLNDVVTARQTEIVRVNKATGARTVVWRGADPAFGQCPSGDPAAAARGVPVQYTDLGFALDAAGAFYVGYANAISDGRGIVKISADGGTCTTVTANGTRPDGFVRGTGPTLGGFVQGFALDGSSILAFTTQPKQLLRIDLATGNRTTVVQAQSGGIIGERWVFADAARQLLWTVGFQNSVTIVGVDTSVATTQPKLLDIFSSCGDPAFPEFPICAGGPININNQNYGGGFLDVSTGRLFFAQDSVALVELELSTGNSIIHSL